MSVLAESIFLSPDWRLRTIRYERRTRKRLGERAGLPGLGCGGMVRLQCQGALLGDGRGLRSLGRGFAGTTQQKGRRVKIYLAARYSRREELCAYRKSLQSMGFNVEARWLDGKHQLSDRGIPIGDTGEALVEGVDDGSTQVRNAELRAKFAQDDWEDVSTADVVINFTEPPRSNASRGGRHVECGIALARNVRVIVVGYRENIFHWLPQVEFAENFDAAVMLICKG